MSHRKKSKGLGWSIKKYCRWFRLSAKQVMSAVEAELGEKIHAC